MTRQTFALGDVALQSGETLIDARLVYRTIGTLNEARDNVIVMPSYYTGSDEDNAKMIGPGRALDPEHYFLVLPNMFGNGVSSSPSNAAPGCRGADFPAVSVYDNIGCQHRLLTELWDVQSIGLVCGWSMGGPADIRMGCALPRHGKSHPALVRLGKNLPPQFRVSRRGEIPLSPPMPPTRADVTPSNHRKA